jgi:LSD1 subclass zinc finger protein
MQTFRAENTALTDAEGKDLKVLALFTDVWCKAKHFTSKEPFAVSDEDLRDLGLERHRLCESCREFLTYAFARRIKCPLDPKPTCKHCHLHCYRPGHRERVREIMRFSGRHLLLRGRLDLLWHYFF